VSDSEPYGLRSLRRAASNGYAVSIYPSEAADVVAEIERLRGALDAERATVAALRASVPPAHPADYGHEAWTAALRDAVREERAAVVAWLREEGSINSMFPVLKGAADEIERGEHRRGEEA